MQPMTENQLKELLADSKCKDSFDSAIVRELFVEFDRLHELLNNLDAFKPNLENMIVRLTESLEQLPNDMTTMEKQLHNELALTEQRLRDELTIAEERQRDGLAMMEKQCQDARKIIDKQNDRFKLLSGLLVSCVNRITNPKTADYIILKMSAINSKRRG
jgi:hypothetical protein